MCESGASFHRVHHNPEEDLLYIEKKQQTVMTTFHNVLFYALCTRFLNSFYLALEHKISNQMTEQL
jgi:hypothetical protein